MEHLPWIALGSAVVLVALCARNARRGQRVIAGQRTVAVGARALALFPVASVRFLVRVNAASSLDRHELLRRARQPFGKDILADAPRIVSIDAVKPPFSFFVAARPDDDAQVLARRVNEALRALETASAPLDGEGAPHGAPIAVRATGADGRA